LNQSHDDKEGWVSVMISHRFKENGFVWASKRPQTT